MDLASATIRAEKLLELVSSWRGMLGLVMEDPFTFYEDDQELYRNIPTAWKEYFARVDEHTVLDMMGSYCAPSDAPTELSEWFAAIKSSMFDRSPRDAARCSPLSHFAARGMTPKKQHEVAVVLSHVPPLATLLGCTQITDVGAGLCKLSVALASVWKHQVVAVDMSHTEGGARRARKHMHPDATNLQIVERTVDASAPLCGADSEACLLVGLHSCGSLGSSMWPNIAPRVAKKRCLFFDKGYCRNGKRCKDDHIRDAMGFTRV